MKDLFFDRTQVVLFGLILACLGVLVLCAGCKAMVP